MLRPIGSLLHLVLDFRLSSEQGARIRRDDRDAGGTVLFVLVLYGRLPEDWLTLGSQTDLCVCVCVCVCVQFNSYP